MSRPVEFVTVDQAMDAHVVALENGGGLGGVRSSHGLASAVLMPQQTVFGEDAYPTIPEKAAAYGFFMAENQPFIDGNKRTAALLMLGFLDLNGYEFHQTDDEIADVFISLGSRQIDQAQFFTWVGNHARPATEEAATLLFDHEHIERVPADCSHGNGADSPMLGPRPRQ